MQKDKWLEKEFFDFAYNNFTESTHPKYLDIAYYPHKKDLYKLLGEQYQIEMPIEYEKSIEEILDEGSRDNSYDKTVITDQEIAQLFFVIRIVLMGEENFYSEEGQLFYEAIKSQLATVSSVVENKVKIPNGNTLKWNKHRITNGEKFFGFLHREFPQIDVESLRLKQSRLVNDKKISGTLVISITPLDYLTMSDDTTNWKSCMSWDNEGCYRGGTLEMLSSDKVVVAYIKDKKGRKKWRELFIVNEDVVCGVKGYPFSSLGLEKKIVNILKDLAAKNMGWEYQKEDVTGFYFETDFMYNDIEHLAEFPYGWSKDLGGGIYYGEGVYCTHCLTLLSTEGGDYGEELFEHSLCAHCSGQIICSNCNDVLNEYEVIYDSEGNAYCAWCANRLLSFCENCETYFQGEEMVTVTRLFKASWSCDWHSDYEEYCPDCFNDLTTVASVLNRETGEVYFNVLLTEEVQEGIKAGELE